MKFYPITLLSIFLIIACKNEPNNRKLKTIFKDGFIAKGYVINDTLFDDTVFYYDESKTLIRKEYFNKGRLDGLSTEYYFNGNPKAQTNYFMGMKNGTNSYFDSSGNCYYESYYYFDLPVGSITFYDKKKYPKRYFFINLQNETLLEIDYTEWTGVKSVIKDCINYAYNIQRQDSTRQISLLLYIIDPPKMAFDYSILKREKNSESKFSKIMDVSSDAPFKSIILPTLPDSMYYSVQLSIYDSILNKKTIIDKEVW